MGLERERNKFIFSDRLVPAVRRPEERKGNRARDRLGKISERPFVTKKDEVEHSGAVRMERSDGRSCVNGVIRGARKGERRGRNYVPRSGNNIPAANLEEEFNRSASFTARKIRMRERGGRREGGDRSYDPSYAFECKQEIVTFPDRRRRGVINKHHCSVGFSLPSE